MALKSCEDLKLVLSNNAEMMLFSEDLVDYMLFRNCRTYHVKWDPNLLRVYIYNALEPIIQRMIYFLECTMESCHDDIFREMKEANCVNSDGYEKFVKTLAAKYFPEGFDAKYFLIYCVNLSIMAAYFYKYDICDAPNLAKVHIYKPLQKYMSVSEWDVIRRIVINYEEMLRDSASDFRLVLEEIEHQTGEQDELRDASTSSFSVEQSVFSRNAENITTYEKYTQCSSEITPEIGLCSGKKPESSSEITPRIALEGNMRINISESDNEPTPVASNVNQELIIIISDFKKKLKLSWNEVKSGNEHDWK